MRKIYLSLVLCVLSISLFAQKGTIRGKVYDKTTGESLIGAAIVLDGTDYFAGTDLDGAYEIMVEPGTYTIKATYISYQDKLVTGAIVKDGDVTVIDIYLSEASEQLAEVVVEAKAVRSTENAVLLMKKDASSVMDGISSQEIKKMGDSDAAGAIKRVTGVSVEGGKYVTVRGLGDRYSKTLLNGSDIPSLDPEKNAVQLDLFPTNLIENMMVYKTFTPDLPADFTGGLINLSTKDFPEKFTLQFSGSWAYNDQATFNNNFMDYEGGKTDWLGIDDGTRAEPKNANTLPSTVYDFTQDLEYNTETVKSFNKTMTTTNKSPFLNQSYSLSVGNQKKAFGKPLGFIVGLTYSKSNRHYDGGTIGRYISPNPGQLITDKLLTDARSQEDVLWGLMLNANMKLNANNKVGLTFLRNQGGNKDSRHLVGGWSEYSLYPNKDIFYSQAMNWVERAITTMQLKGEHNIPSLGNTKIEWISSYTASSQDQPDFRLFAYDWEDGVGYQISQQAYQPPARFYRSMEEDNFDNKLHITVPFENNSGKGNVKFGGAYLYKNRDFAEYQYDYNDNNRSFGNVDNDPVNGEYFINADRIQRFIADENIITSSTDQGFWMRSNRQMSNTYNGKQSVAAAYIMTNFPVTPRLKFVGGVRFETTNIRVESENPRDQIGEIDKADILPSANFNYDLNELMKLRFGYNRTIARPTFREMAPFASYLFAGDYVLVGNPDLDRTLIDNFDVRWEYYPGIGDLISASVFYKKFDSPIERRISPSAANLEVSFVNVPSATVAGAEVEFRKQLGFLSNEYNQTKLGLNASYIYARTKVDSAEYAARKEIDPNAKDTRPMYGQSPFIVNAYLSYSNVPKNWRASIAYNIWGERLSFVSRGRVPDVYEQSRGVLDFTFEKGLGDKWSISIKAQNLLNPDYYQTHDFEGQEYDFERYTVGRTYSLGVKYSL